MRKFYANNFSFVQSPIYYEQGKYEEAEPLYLKVLEIRKKLLREEHRNITQSLNNLASLYHEQGRYKEAEALYLEALKITEKILG